MSNPARRPHGVPIWTDLLTPLVPECLRFYRDTFGWNFTEAHDGQSGYLMCRIGEESVCSIGDLNTLPQARGGWTLYVAVDDAQAAARHALALGGSILLGPLDLAEEGRLALAMDPAGGVLGLWEGRNHLGAEALGVPGALSFCELAIPDLATPDGETAKSYYAELLGWQVAGAADEYATITAHGQAVGGIRVDTRATPTSAETNWTVCFSVADAARQVDEILTSGGKLVDGPRQTPGGQVAVFHDPAGARFAVVSAA
jgi:predicted enzyme related to lactoylglutathione lyase